MSKKEDRPSILDHDANFDIICVKIITEGLSIRAIARALALANIRASNGIEEDCLLYTSPSPRDRTRSRMPSSA